MAATDCVLRRTLRRSRTAPNQRSQVVCRETLYVLDVLRYTRDLGSSIYFPHTVFSGDDLYDVTLSDRDCRLRVTLDPGLNVLVERHVLRLGAALRTATLAPAMVGLADRTEDQSFILVNVEMSVAAGDDESRDSDWDSLPWSGSPDVSGPLLASRAFFLPLWNKVDFHGDAWKQTPPPMSEHDGKVYHPSVTIKGLREGFIGRKVWVRGSILHRLILRITAKSKLTYYGKADRNSKCPYQVGEGVAIEESGRGVLRTHARSHALARQGLLEACDRTGSVSVVMWNGLCVNWFCVLKPGDVISLSHFRVKRRYMSEGDDIEISANSQNLAARISLLPEASVAPARLPPPASAYDFCGSEQLSARAHGAVCDVIGLLVFAGRSERLRKGSELLEYRWLRLQDGRCSRPIWIQLFATSQPQTHRRLHPCGPDGGGSLVPDQHAAHNATAHRRAQRLRPAAGGAAVPRLAAAAGRQADEARGSDWRVLRLPAPSRLLGNVHERQSRSADRHRRAWKGNSAASHREPGFLRGTVLLREMKKLCYRERRTFCIEATVTMVAYCSRGEEGSCIFWRDASSSLSSSSSSSSPSPSSSCRVTPSPTASQRTARPLTSTSSGRPCKRKLLLHSDTPAKGRPRATVQPKGSNETDLLFEASMEFLHNTDDDDEEEEEEEEDEQGDTSYSTSSPSPPHFPHVAVETLAMRYNPACKKEQAVAVTMGGSLTCAAVFASDNYYTLRLKALSDDTCIHAIFLPQSSSSSLLPRPGSHGNTWASILSHGAFSSHAPPPSPGDLIATARQLANRRLACLLDVCHLGGDSNEVVIRRAFPMT
ncbi:RPA-related protein RADX isoform X3 [Phyllopteryx taeniolatus]|uniref:RPA-related protein RADX isoform X3 n=1 Tax=Phyllopteryx taeniolatus TaxID=161469 RepID=UPI002AD5A893|nr:RPA-related protein RADX isoform X3 [Phyllopteryx taeniolatus]